MEKMLKDRLNQLKSKYQEITNVKLTKIINTSEAEILNSKIQEIKWLICKYNKLNEK